MRIRLGLLLAFCVTVPAFAASPEDALSARWRGAWVVLGSEVFSDCDASYTNNEVVGRRASSKGALRFAAGELGQVHKLELKRSRVELLVDLDESFLRPFHDGPFDLVDEVRCKVELKLELPREVVKSGDVAALERALSALAERFATREAALRSPSANGRKRGSFPKDYDEKLAAYRRWKTEQTNRAVGERLDQALEDAARVAKEATSNPDYGAGFAAGLEAMRWLSYSDCSSWLGSSFYAVKKSVPSEHRSNRAFCDGFDDGQLLAYSVELAHRLRGCFVPEP